jgi:predicted kinase
MEILNSSGWIWIKNSNSTEKRDQIKGKYLFFSDNKEELIELGKQILNKYGLLVAKTPISEVANKNKGFGFVLCVYDIINRYSNELKTLETNSISYRYWKSDDDTRNKKYSKQYKNSNQWK